MNAHEALADGGFSAHRSFCWYGCSYSTFVPLEGSLGRAEQEPQQSCRVCL